MTHALSLLTLFLIVVHSSKDLRSDDILLQFLNRMAEETIKFINSKKEYEDLITFKHGLTVVDFSAEWCGPCRLMTPIYKRLSREFKKVVFATVDVDDHEDIAEEEGVTAMPVFKFYRGGKMVDQLTGANKEQLREKIELHQ